MATVEQTTMKVQRLLTGKMGLKVAQGAKHFQVRLQDVKIAINIEVLPFGTDPEGNPATIVRLWAVVLSRVRPSSDLFEWVAREGGNRWFGHVLVFDDEESPGTVLLTMTHSLLGDTVDEGELWMATKGVFRSADTLADDLQKRFGGGRGA